MYVMRFNRDRLDDLFVKGNAASRAAHGRKQLVIKPFAPAKPATVYIKGYTRNQNQVQPVRRNGDAFSMGLADAELAMAQVVGSVVDLAGDVTVSGSIETGQGDGLAGGQ